MDSGWFLEGPRVPKKSGWVGRLDPGLKKTPVPGKIPPPVAIAVACDRGSTAHVGP
jgi:hypothetical protein